MRVLLIWRAQFLGPDGGMEHVCSGMANHLAETGNEAGILCCAEKEGTPFFPLSPDVKLFNMLAGMENAKEKYMPPWAAGIRECLRICSKPVMFRWVSHRKNKILVQPVQRVVKNFRPDVIVSFDPETTILLRESLGLPFPVPLITMFHFSVKKVIQYHSEEERQAISSSYAVQLLTEQEKEEFCTVFPDVRAVCIPNAVSPCPVAAHLTGHLKHRIVCIARFEKTTKRQHILIQAFSRLADQFPDWNLSFYGSQGTAYTEELKKMIADRNLSQQIHILPPVKDVYSVYQNSDIAGIPSAYEGFGLSLAEGMNAGLPAVGFASCPGVNELIADGKNGFLAEDGIEAFADKLKVLMNDEGLRVKMGLAARRSVQKYAPSFIWKSWDALLKQAAESYKKQ